MSTVDVAPVVTVTTDEVADENRRLAHKRCFIDRQRDVRRGLCGTPILGIPAKPGRPKCAVCKDLWPEHRDNCPTCWDRYRA